MSQFHGKEVEVMFVSSLENFSVILAEDLEQLQLIQADINSSSFLAQLKEKQKQEDGKRPIKVGDKVLARFQEDRQLYRAEMVDTDPGDGLFKVFYCDFGNVGNTDEVYPLPDNLKNIRGLSIRCRLACSTDDEVKKANQEFARNISSGSRLVLQVLKVKKNCLEVDLVKMTEDGATSIRDLLVFLGLAYFAPQEESHELPNIFRKKIENHQLDLKVGEIHKGFVGHIPFAHPGDWVQISVLVSSAVPVYRLPRLMEKMKRTYSHPKSEAMWGLAEMLTPGIVCAAQDEEDGLWYRAVVVNRIRGRIYSVRYVDFGEKRILSVYSLRRLFPEFRDYIPELAKTVSVPVKIATAAQAHSVNSGLRRILMQLEVGFQVREVKKDIVLVDMDYQGEEIEEIVKYLKMG